MSKIPIFEMFNLEKQRPLSDAGPQDSNGAICFSVRGLEPPPPKKKKITFWLYDVTISRHVVERNLAFGVKHRGIDLKF